MVMGQSSSSSASLHRGVDTRAVDLFSQQLLALAIAVHGRVIADRRYEVGDVRAEALGQLTGADLGVRHDVVQQAGGNQDIRAAGSTQQPCDFQRMLDERCTVAGASLTGVSARSERQRRLSERRRLILAARSACAARSDLAQRRWAAVVSTSVGPIDRNSMIAPSCAHRPVPLVLAAIARLSWCNARLAA
jgi:hypothetical protein